MSDGDAARDADDADADAAPESELDSAQPRRNTPWERGAVLSACLVLFCYVGLEVGFGSCVTALAQRQTWSKAPSV